MALNKAQLMEVPGGPGSVGAIKTTAGSGITISPDGLVSLTSIATPGSFTNANITIDAFGRVTSASNGSGGGGVSSVTGSGGITVNPTTGSVVVDGTGKLNLSGGTMTGNLEFSNNVGLRWSGVNGFALKNVVYYDNSGTYNTPSGCKCLVVQIVGGGGGGGGTGSTTSGLNEYAGAGSGGGGAGMSWGIIFNPSSSYGFTIGSGGNGAGGGAGDGSGGGNSSFAGLTGSGGGGGRGMTVIGKKSGNTGGTTYRTSEPGSRGDASGGNIDTIRGGRGLYSIAFGNETSTTQFAIVTCSGGGGAATLVGANAVGARNNDGFNSETNGSGGTGAWSEGNQNRPGGNGSKGVLIIQEYF